MWRWCSFIWPKLRTPICNLMTWVHCLKWPSRLATSTNNPSKANTPAPTSTTDRPTSCLSDKSTHHEFSPERCPTRNSAPYGAPGCLSRFLRVCYEASLCGSATLRPQNSPWGRTGGVSQQVTSEEEKLRPKCLCTQGISAPCSGHIGTGKHPTLRATCDCLSQGRRGGGDPTFLQTGSAPHKKWG